MDMSPTNLPSGKPVIVFGGGGHARVVAGVLQQLGHEVRGFVYGQGDAGRASQPWLGDDDWIAKSDPDKFAVHVAIGSNSTRLRLLRELIERGFEAPVLVSPNAFVAHDVRVSPGSIIMAGSVVEPGVQIGTGVIVNTSASINHDCIVGAGAHVAPGATICGSCIIERETLIGAGATILPGIVVGERAVIGAGSVLLKAVAAHRVVAGVPARVISDGGTGAD